ncbi:hypothetical protein SDC9_172905 [bioreactor metagenome]|uniref:Uncharacterized protein n=1 Tax=bioreactor metagenome TaxID=1076179 RepID=A0A645GNF7_9ZZZZ
MAAGDKALPLQRGQDVSQLSAADAEFFRQNALSGQAFAGGKLTVLHGGQQLNPDGFGLGWLVTHIDNRSFRFHSLRQKAAGRDRPAWSRGCRSKAAVPLRGIFSEKTR